MAKCHKNRRARLKRSRREAERLAAITVTITDGENVGGDYSDQSDAYATDYDDPDGVWETCWQCGGECGFHECGEDCCPHIHPELDLNEVCQECEGRGGYYVR